MRPKQMHLGCNAPVLRMLLQGQGSRTTLGNPRSIWFDLI